MNLLLHHCCTSVCIEAMFETPPPPQHWNPWGLNLDKFLPAPLPFPLSRFSCFSSFTLLTLQLGITPATCQSANVTEPVVCGDARPLVCDGDAPVVTVTASTQQQQAPWTAQDSCTAGCYHVLNWALEFPLYIIPLLCGIVLRGKSRGFLIPHPHPNGMEAW